MNPILIPFSRVEELEQATRSIGPLKGLFRFVGSCTLMEAATICRRVDLLLGSSKGRWTADEDSIKILRSSALHYETLDLLEFTLDLKDSVPMMRIRFDDVRATANRVITTADRSNVLGLLDEVTIESQRLSRVCRELGFGNEDNPEASLTQEDLNWLMADGALILTGELSDGEGDGDNEVFPGHADGAEENVALVDGCEDGAGLFDAGEVLPVPVDGSNERALVGEGGVDGRNVLGSVGDDKEGGDSGKQGEWVEFKEKTVISLLRSKIRKLRQTIVTAKGRSVSA